MFINQFFITTGYYKQESMKEKKHDFIIKQCVYEIATGKWRPGSKLPSIREAENLWGVNRLAILEAYRELANMGLAVAKDRSGFFVADGTTFEEISSNRDSLEQLFYQLNEVIQQNSTFSSLGVFRYLTQLAEIKAQEKPEVAFIECSLPQARGHGQEISQRYQVPVLPICLNNQEPTATEIPSFVKALLTTGFHFEEVNQLAKQYHLPVHNVPIELAPDLLQEVDDSVQKVILMELDKPMSKSIVEDLKKLVPKLTIEEKIVSEINTALEALLSSKASQNAIILLSPRVWGSTRKKWQNHSQVALARFTIKTDAWDIVVKALRLPLGFIS
ncbi:MAG TPA: hypothetical protein DCS93_06360 [Microscillaceae bacterium]|nr:hypothetical protein [Microscillaceae bacterium]